MVIVQIDGGLGNQMDQYAVGRYVAHILNTELKIMLQRPFIPKDSKATVNYKLGYFNIHEVFATPEEIKRVKETGIQMTSWQEMEKYGITFQTWKNVKNLQGDVFIAGHWVHNPAFYQGIADIIKKEFTLKEPFHPKAEAWHQKITSVECSVSMHFRHGDYAYDMWRVAQKFAWAPILPLDYYYTCIDILKQRYNNFTVFVFSDNLPWVKENLHLDVPTEFVEGCETDHEEWILMSLCKHNIIGPSTFSGRASWLNSNPDKKIFAPAKSTAEDVKTFLNSLTPERKEALLKNGLIRVPYNFDAQPEITMRPIFSLLLVVNDDAETISDTLDSLLGQDYKYYEVIIIDNASTDGSDKICRQVIASKKNVTYKRLRKKVSNATAWNRAFKIAQGYYVSFLKSGDYFITNALRSLYGINQYQQTDIIYMFASLAENEQGTIAFADKKYSAQRDTRFKDEKRAVVMGTDGQAAATLLLDGQIHRFLGTKIYNREFLKDNGIKFDEHLADNEAEIFFQIEAFFKSKYFMHISNAFYVAPKA